MQGHDPNQAKANELAEKCLLENSPFGPIFCPDVERQVRRVRRVRRVYLEFLPEGISPVRTAISKLSARRF